MSLPAASIFSEFWDERLVENDRQWVFLVLLGLLLSFGFIRLSTRLIRSPRVPWWPGSVVSGSGVHVHHLVFGIVLMMIAGTLGLGAFETDVVRGLCAFGFGIGMGLTIDEFALWVYLKDVYWAKEGRSSVDAAVIAATLMALLLMGVHPLDFGDGEEAGSTLGAILTGAVIVGCIVVCFMKKRVAHGIFGFFLPPLALYGAARLGKPDSGWARRFYGDRDPDKQARSKRRFDPGRRTERLKDSLITLIGGSTEADYEKKLKEKGRA